MNLRNTFLGKLNLDADTRLLQPGEYRDALNIRTINSEGSDVGAIEKSLSNKKLTNLSLGDNVYTLSSLRDEFEEKIYWAVLSDDGCFVIEHEVATETTTLVLHDTRSGAANILGFTPSNRLQMALIVDSDNNNRLLAFTDNNNQPKLINIERAKTYGENGFTEEDILLIKKPPINAPTITLGNTANKENFVTERFLVFLTRFKYLDGEYSALSPASEHAFHAKPFQYNFASGSNDAMVNNYNKVTVGFDTGSHLVTDIELVVMESGSNTLYVVERFNKDDKSWADNTTQSFEFVNNKKSLALPEKELYRLYDNVPLLAKAMAVINNRIVFGNYTENYDLIDGDSNPLNKTITVDSVQTAITSGTATPSLKVNRDYEIARVYLDEYGRMCTPITSENNTIYFPLGDCVLQNQIRVTIPGKAPAFAKYMRFFIKENKKEYDTIVPTLFYFEGNFVYFYIQQADIDRVEKNDFVIVKSDTEGIKDEVIKLKVIEVEKKEKDFINTENGGQPAGYYLKTSVLNEDVRFDGSSYSFYRFEHYDQSENGDIIADENTDYIKTVFKGDTLDDLTPSSSYSNGADLRYEIEIQDLAIASGGSVELTGGASGSVDGITVNTIQIMSGAETFDTDLDTTASNVADNINAHTSTPNYTAVAVGSVINITPVDVGSASNGYAVVSSTTTITTTDTNMSGGKNDTFRFRTQQTDGTLSSWDDNGGDNYEITGASQTVDANLDVTFGDVSGHSINDNWLVKINEGFLIDEDNRSYAAFAYNDTITIGSLITMSYYSKQEKSPSIDQFVMNFTSNGNYADLEEWYYGDDIFTQISAEPNFDQTLDKFWFRQCTVTEIDNPFFTSASAFTIDTSGTHMVLFIESRATSRNSSRDVYSDVFLEVRALDQLPIFEKENPSTEDDADIFYEIGRTYQIDSNGYHLAFDGNDTTQTAVQDGVFLLSVFNCFSWGNGFESYKLRDYFNAKSMKINTRPSTPIENYRQNKRIASYTFSNVYEQSTNYNALNEFNLSLLNFNDLDDKYGAIQAMHAWDNDLDVWQEDKVIKVLYDKSVLYNKDGSGNVAKTDDILKDWIPYAGEFGISTNPEGLAVYGNYAYWPDAKRGVFLRKGQSGIEIISNFGFRDWTRDAMINLSTFILGGYDPYFGQYVFSLNGNTATYDEKVKGLTSFHSWVPDDMVRINNRFFTIKDGQLYLHNATDNGVNHFYGVQYASKVTTVFNQEPHIDKIFKTIITESESAWKATVTTNLTNSSILASEFNNRESRWFGYIRQNENSNDLRGVSQGIGRILSHSGTAITFNNVSETVSIGDKLYQVNVGSQEELGTITSINNGVITVGSLVNTPVNGNFCFGKKDSRINGASVRGYYMEVELEDNGLGANELFAVSTNAVKSYL